MPADLEPLEAAVLAMLLTGDHAVLAALRHQLATATITRRELTGVGFFVDFAVAASAVPAPVRQLRFGDVEATLAGLQHGAGFVVFVDDGRLTMFEGFTYGEPWPAPVAEFTLRYHDPARADLPTQLTESRRAPVDRGTMDELLVAVQRVSEQALAKCIAEGCRDSSMSAREVRQAFVVAADAGEFAKWSIADGNAVQSLDCDVELSDDGKLLLRNEDELVREIRAIELQRVLAGKSVVAQSVLGARYLFGSGVPKDDEAAFQLLSRAASRGAPRALSNLASMYERGLGTSQDVVTASQLYERAATAGEFLAQVALGRLYSRGGALPVDLTRARYWYVAAVAQEARVVACEELQEAKDFLACRS